MAVGEGPSRELLGRRVMTAAFSGMSLGDSVVSLEGWSQSPVQRKAREHELKKHVVAWDT